MEYAIGCIIVGVIIIIMVLRIKNDVVNQAKQTKIALAKQETKDFAWIRGNKLYLRKRDPKMCDIVSIGEFVSGHIRYNPETLHYGSVTVGGITTGGFYKTGGNYYMSDVQKSGVFKRLYYGDTQIFDIDLTLELYNQAKDSYIAKYLDGMNIEVMDRKSANAIATLTRDQSVISQCSGRTYEECFEILSWICGVDDLSEIKKVEGKA